MTTQLSLFDPLDFDDGSNLPIPLRAAKHFGFPLQHHDDLYALQDWVRGLTGEMDGNELKGMMRRLKSEVSFKNTSEKMPYKAADGKTYKRDFVDSRGLYQAVAYLRAKKDRESQSAIGWYKKEHPAQPALFTLEEEHHDHPKATLGEAR